MANKISAEHIKAVFDFAERYGPRETKEMMVSLGSPNLASVHEAQRGAFIRRLELELDKEYGE